MKTREGMRRAICAVYVESWEDRLYYRKHNGIAQFYYEPLSDDADAGVSFLSSVHHIRQGQWRQYARKWPCV